LFFPISVPFQAPERCAHASIKQRSPLFSNRVQYELATNFHSFQATSFSVLSFMISNLRL